MKVDEMVNDFLKDAAVGHGGDWQGILFFRDAVQLSCFEYELTKQLCGGVRGIKLNRSKRTFMWPSGESLRLAVGEDYWCYHGLAYPWVGSHNVGVEFGNKIRSILRRLNQNVPMRLLSDNSVVRFASTPNAPGSNWVKDRKLESLGKKEMQEYLHGDWDIL
ncbi:MAG: hypothetical protein KAR40_06120 [Candidatus Sabulitectum sp.]|nr:hypothetical protein [Candidatus Sabulitectum sp.]